MSSWRITSGVLSFSISVSFCGDGGSIGVNASEAKPQINVRVEGLLKKKQGGYKEEVGGASRACLVARACNAPAVSAFSAPSWNLGGRFECLASL
jgi:hypothetical protein